MKQGVIRTAQLLRSGELAERYRGLVVTQEHPGGGLVVLNYTRECQYAAAWDEVTTACRGLMIDTRSWRVAAWPMPKFFNVNERPETLLEALPAEPFHVFDKLDGSLGVLFRDADGPALASRGSFTSEQAVRGTAFLRSLSGWRDIPESLTLLFEVIYPENKSVVRYPFEGLVLLVGYDRHTGDELPWDEVRGWGERLGCRTPKVYPFTTLADVAESRAGLPAGLEGYVVRFASGLRVKLKGDAYLALHKAVWGLSEKIILEALAESEAAFEELQRDLPEEFRDEFGRMTAAVRERGRAVEAEVRGWFERVPGGVDRKTFALWVQANVPRALWGPVFQLLDGRTPNWFRHVSARGLADAPRSE
jgi:RNA ligase